MSARILFAYAVLLMALVLVGYVLAQGSTAKQVLIVPGLCALLVAGVSAAGSALTGRPQLRLLVLRIAATLPLIVGAALAMRATRIGHRVGQGAEDLASTHVLIWTMAGASVVAFLLLQYQRFRYGNH